MNKMTRIGRRRRRSQWPKELDEMPVARGQPGGDGSQRVASLLMFSCAERS